MSLLKAIRGVNAILICLIAAAAALVVYQRGYISGYHDAFLTLFGANHATGQKQIDLLSDLILFFSGMAFGVFLMAVVQHQSKTRNKTDFERLGNSIRAGHPRRWNGRYPRDAERR